MIRFLVPACCLVMLGVAGVVAFLPWTNGAFYPWSAATAFAVARYGSGRPLWRKPPAAFWPVALALFALIPGIVLERLFRDIDTAAFVFHARLGISGTPFSAYSRELFVALAAVGVMGLALWLLSAHLRHANSVLVGAALVLVLANPLVRAFVHDRISHVPSDLSRRLVAVPQPLIAEVAARPDVLILYLEGMDRQFADQNLWPGLYDPLAALAAEGATFTRIAQLQGTGWSIAGMAATQCGVPLVPNGLLFHKDLDRVAHFLPAQRCLGDLLAARGYQNAYIVGGSSTFGGIASFYQSHGFPVLDDRAVLEAIYPEEVLERAGKRSIYDDQLVFDHARRRFDELANGPDPFLIVIETYGPHDATGLLSRRCTPEGKAALSQDTAGVITCLLALTTDFLTHVRQRHAELRPGHDLRIAIFSDHVNHNRTLPQAAPAYRGFNSVILIGAELPRLGEIDTPGTMIDVYPSLLEWLGLSGPNTAAGLGRTLWTGAPTLAAEIGLDRLNAMLRTDAALAERLWSVPSAPMLPGVASRFTTARE